MRFLLAFSGAAMVTLTLFWIMHTMISGTDSGLKKLDQDWVVQIVRLIPDSDTNERKHHFLKKPALPKKPPALKAMKIAKVQKQAVPELKMPMPKLGDVQMVGGPSLGGITKIPVVSSESANVVPAVESRVVLDNGFDSEAETVALVKIAPRYPRKAARAGIQGWVKIEFTILEDGTVEAPVVVDAKPNRIFNREAIRAILKWKFKPKVVNGKPVKRRALQKIGFDLSKV